MELALVDPATILLLGIAALLAGFIDAIAGDGGMLVMPALLSTGMPPHLVVGTNKLVGTFGTFSASLTLNPSWFELKPSPSTIDANWASVAWSFTLSLITLCPTTPASPPSSPSHPNAIVPRLLLIV